MMNKRGAGVAFCTISAFLLFSRYFFKVALYLIKEGKFMIGYSTNFLAIKRTLNLFGILSIIALIVGVIYLIIAEIEDKNK